MYHLMQGSYLFITGLHKVFRLFSSKGVYPVLPAPPDYFWRHWEQMCALTLFTLPTPYSVLKR